MIGNNGRARRKHRENVDASGHENDRRRTIGDLFYSVGAETNKSTASQIRGVRTENVDVNNERHNGRADECALFELSGAMSISLDPEDEDGGRTDLGLGLRISDSQVRIAISQMSPS